MPRHAPFRANGIQYHKSASSTRWLSTRRAAQLSTVDRGALEFTRAAVPFEAYRTRPSVCVVSCGSRRGMISLIIFLGALSSPGPLGRLAVFSIPIVLCAYSCTFSHFTEDPDRPYGLAFSYPHICTPTLRSRLNFGSSVLTRMQQTERERSEREIRGLETCETRYH